MHDKVKKGFLQACLNHGSLPLDNVTNILALLCEAYEVEPPNNLIELKALLNELNAEIKEYNHALTLIQHPLVNTHFLVFGLTAENEVFKQQPHYTSADKHYFLKLVEKLLHQKEYGVAWNELYFIEGASSSTLQKQLPKNRMQELVMKWTAQGYFIEHNELLYLGPRMLVEYSSYLKVVYPDLVQDCPLCYKLVFWDIQCAECETKIHGECLRKYLTRMSTCPSCKMLWNTPLTQPQ